MCQKLYSDHICRLLVCVIIIASLIIYVQYHVHKLSCSQYHVHKLSCSQYHVHKFQFLVRKSWFLLEKIVCVFSNLNRLEAVSLLPNFRAA